MPRVRSLVQRKKRDPITRELEVLRQDAGMTKKELSEHMGICVDTLHRRYTKDANGYTVGELKRAADALHVKLKIAFEEVT